MRRRKCRHRSRRAEGLRPWVKRFLTSYLPQHRGASPHTISSYAHTLKSLIAFLSRRRKKRRGPTFANLTAENVLAFLARLEKKRKNGPVTRNVRLAAIRSFLRFAFVMGCIEKGQYERVQHIAFKHCGRKVISYLEPAELNAVFRAVDHSMRDGFRDLVILKLLYNTGARASEIAELRISDLSLGDLRVTFIGKGRKERTCSLWQTTVALLRIYLSSERRTPRKGFDDCLFIDQRRRPFTRSGVYRLVRRYAVRAAESCPSLAKKDVTPHSIRHTTAVHLIASGVDINTVRDWLGHAHISTTEIYTRADLQTKRLALEKLRDLDRKLLEEIAKGRGVPKVDPGIRRWLKSLSE